ncbi:MAG: phosphoserine phosphatase [Patescibacteria group bacterium]|nr:phosphoserine phosphatase [Patescibacteria group bacterium]
MDLFIVRHGETDENNKHIIQGWLNTQLNATGLEQAQKAADNFDEIVEVIFASDLKRATQTAEVFRRKFPDIVYFEDRRLRERNFGDLMGRTKLNYDWNEFWSSPSDQVTIPNAETLDSFNLRINEFINELRSSDYEKVLIVAHSGTINRLCYLIAAKNHSNYGNGSITHLVLN